MPPEPPRLTLLQQRTIEARVLGPLIRAFQEELGAERANAIARRAIEGIARQRGRELAGRMGRDDLEAFVEVTNTWRGQGDLEIEVLERTPTRYSFNVTRCRFAEMYRELGLADLGGILSCGRDFVLCQGFSPRIRLRRTQTIMQGAPYCDFRYTCTPAEGQGDAPSPPA